MSINILGSEETFKRDRCLQASDIISQTYCGFSTPNTASVTKTLNTFTADQNYFLTAVSLSLACNVNDPTSSNDVKAALFVLKNVQNLNVTGSNQNPGNVLASLIASGGQNQTPSVEERQMSGPTALYLNFAPYGFYIRKGIPIYITGVGMGSGTISIYYSVILYLIPTYS